MFKYIILLALVALIHAAPVEEQDHEVLVAKKKHEFVDIVEQANEHNPDGSYSFSYRGEDGGFREETAVVKNQGTSDEHLEITGSYSFIDDNGEEVVVHYTADKNGFVPVGDNIPDSISAAAKQAAQLPKLEVHESH